MRISLLVWSAEACFRFPNSSLLHFKNSALAASRIRVSGGKPQHSTRVKPSDATYKLMQESSGRPGEPLVFDVEWIDLE